MLTDLLGYLDGGGAYSQDELARLIGTDRDTVMAGVQQLAHMGYLQKISMQPQSGCAKGSCKGCPGCATDRTGAPVFWERVPK